MQTTIEAETKIFKAEFQVSGDLYTQILKFESE